jgi:hypothetical protein
MIKKTSIFPSNIIEKSIRKYSIKSNGSLDLIGASTYIRNNDKFFYGKENNNSIQITRIKYPFENILPKFIIVFNKADYKNYNIRLGYLSIILFTFFVAFTFFIISLLIYQNRFDIDDISWLLSILFAFIGLSYIEYNLTLKKLNYILKKE